MTIRRCLVVFLVAFLSAIVGAQEPDFELDPVPGLYGTAIELRSVGDVPIEYRFVTAEGEPHTTFFLPFEDAIVLRAPSGAEANYHIELREDSRVSTVHYGIDTRPPASPSLTPPPGLYTVDQMVLAATDEEATIFVLQESTGRFRSVDEAPIPVLGTAGEVSDVAIVAYAEDLAGNRSEARSYTYRIDRREERSAATRIIQSPVGGAFRNEQLLLLDTMGLTDLQYTITEAGDARSGAYGEPFIVSGDGTLELTVEAVETVSGRTRTERVEWMQQPGATDFELPTVVTDAVTIDRPEHVERYTLQDRPVRVTDPIQSESFELRAAADVRRVVVLRRRIDGNDSEERRVFVLDGRRPPPPRIFEGENEVRLVALADTEIVYRLGGGETTPDGAPRYEHPIALSPGEETVITAWARYPGGAWSSPLRGTIPSGPVPVAITEDDLTWDGTTLTMALSPGTRYRVDGLNERPAIAAGEIRYRPPRGFDTTLEVVGDDGFPATIPVDAAPPAPPAISVDGTRVSVEGEGTLYFRIDGGIFTEYERAVTLPGEEGVRIDYRVDAYRVSGGEQSVTARRIVPIDRRPLVLPSFVETVDGGRFNEERLELHFASSYDDLQIFYELSADGTPSVPTQSSPVTSSTILVSTPENEVYRWNLALRGRFPGRPGWTPVKRISFVVDRVPPSPPVVVRPSASVEGVGRVILEFQEAEDDARLFYRLDDGQLYLPYEGPLSINAPEVGSRTYRIDAYTIDAAGNRTPLATPLTATVTSLRPAPPVYALNGRPISTASVSLDREAILSLETGSFSGVGLLSWRIIGDTDGGFTPYSEPYRLLMPPEGDERTVRVEAYRETPDGLRSPVVRTTIILDRSAPVLPPAPFVHRVEGGRSGFLIWPGGDTNQVFVAIEDSDPEEVFLPTNGRIAWSIPAGEEDVRISYFTIDDAGNRSEPGFLTIRAPEEAYVPEVYGVENDGVYRSERTVELRGDLPIRYTVSLDGTRPPIVHPLSAIYEEPLRFTASVGEEVPVRIRYRSQNEEGTLSEEGEISFTIDRHPPDQPQLTGVVPDAYYPDTRHATLTASDGDRIFYRIFASEDPPSDFGEYGGETIELPAINREVAEYRIEAYAVDGAGNRSPTIERWRVSIDREIVYVAPAAASGGSGSRNSPFRTLDEAFDWAIADDRSTVFLAGGRYETTGDALRHAIDVLPGLALIGGFASDSWRENASETVISGTDGALPIYGDLRVRSLTLQGGVHIEPGGESSLEKVTLSGGRENPTIVAAGAATRFADSDVLGPIFVGEEATLLIERTNAGAVYLDGGVLVADGGTIGPVVGSAADVTLRTVTMSTPRHAPVVPDRASALPRVNTTALIVLRDSELRVEGSLLDSSDAHANTSLINVWNSSASIRESALRARARGAALLVRQNGGELSIENSRLVSTGERYSYGIVQRGGSASYANSVLFMDGGEEIIGLIESDGSSVAAHVLIELRPSTTSRVVQGINHTGGGGVHLVNSIVATEPFDPGIAAEPTGVYLDAPSVATVYGSLLAGWRGRDLVQAAGPSRWSTRDTVVSADQLERGSYGAASYDTFTFSSGIRPGLLVETGPADIAATIALGDIAALADRGVPINSVPAPIMERFGRSSILEYDLRGVARDTSTPDIGPVEF